MLILGIDPGTARLGYGLIEVAHTAEHPGKFEDKIEYITSGCLETKLETPMAERLLFLQDEVAKIFREHKPDILAIEMLFFGVNTKTAIAVGQARGVILAEAARHHVPVSEYQGLSVKFALTGFGRSDKKQMQESVRQKLRMDKIIKPDDAADGLAIAITHHIKSNLNMHATSLKKVKAKKK